MWIALEKAQRAYVLEAGKIIHNGKSDELKKDSIKKAYIGM
jgi:ABC-type branched-subunit amino acid transport system ATPase component